MNCVLRGFVCGLDVGNVTVKVSVAKQENHLWQISVVLQNQSPAFCSKIHNIVIYCLSSVSSYLVVNISTIVGQIQCS